MLVISSPRRLIVPVVGKSSPAIMANNVVLPDPDGPTIEVTSPELIVKLTSLSIVKTPSGLLTSLVMFWTSKIDSFTKCSCLSVAILLIVITTATSASDATSINKKILVLGDSLSAGLGVDYQESWPLLLQTRLSQGGYNYLVVNAGISGDTTSGGVSRLPKLISLHQPEILILELGGNDGLRGTSLKAIEKNLRDMINSAQSSNITVLLIGVQLPPNYGMLYTKGFEDIFSDLAKEYGLDLIQGSLKTMVNEGLMQSDGIHPNVLGHQQIENIIWERLNKYLEK